IVVAECDDVEAARGERRVEHRLCMAAGAETDEANWHALILVPLTLTPGARRPARPSELHTALRPLPRRSAGAPGSRRRPPRLPHPPRQRTRARRLPAGGRVLPAQRALVRAQTALAAAAARARARVPAERACALACGRRIRPGRGACPVADAARL